MPDRDRRALIALAILVLVALAAKPVAAAILDRSGARGVEGAPEITPTIRAAGLQFDAGVAPADQAWIRAAIASARPEAQRLIDEVDGLVTVRTDLNAPGVIYGGSEQAIGLAHIAGGTAEIVLDVRRLDGDRALDRNVVVLHELGHIVDYVLVDDALVQQLDAGIPPAGACTVPSEDYGACTSVPERFADTFAKWALRGRFSLAGSGYGIPTPPSLEDWGMPLGRLALELDAKARQ
jgi:hypothetical protein